MIDWQWRFPDMASPFGKETPGCLAAGRFLEGNPAIGCG